MCFRGTNIFVGYYKQEDKTREAFDDDGWLMSGDIGLWTTDGALKIIGGWWWYDGRDGVGDVGVGVDFVGGDGVGGVGIDGCGDGLVLVVAAALVVVVDWFWHVNCWWL